MSSQSAVQSETVATYYASNTNPLMKLRSAVAASGLSQTEFAHLIRMPQRSLQALLSGRRTVRQIHVDSAQLGLIRLGMGVDLDPIPADLFTRREKRAKRAREQRRKQD